MPDKKTETDETKTVEEEVEDRLAPEDAYKGAQEGVNRAKDDRETAGIRRNIPRVAEVVDRPEDDDDNC